MAGNIVKWWKHKILGGYKQFTVLQECATDSEELIYPIRAPSSCSAPPDLLLTSSGGDHNEAINHRVSVSHSVPVTTAAVSSGKSVREQNIYQTHSYKEESGSERMHLEEFTCDISVEGGKSSQPLQFSFTFYDLDGHHGKITKDDIAGIVYTIYESIGKSVVVPHCGSKTINVRLTVSPDSKAKPTKISAVTPRRRRYKSKRHTANSDDENDVIHENTTTEMREPPLQMKSHLADSTNHQSLFSTSTPTKGSDNSAVAKECFRSVELPCCIEAKTLLQENLKATNVCHPLNTTELQDNIYESIKNIKLKRTEQQRADVAVCRDCTSHQCAGGVEATATATAVVVPPVKLSTRKVLRKSRSRRHKTAGQSGCHERRRSLSVGNENCWRNVKEGSGSGGGAEDLKNHFKKDDLFDIIRESMEKNRLCFQSNGKTTSPSRHHRHRSQTISKIVDDREPSAPYHHHHNQQSSQPLTSPVISHTNSRPNWCGYDSFLHATLCSNNAHSPHAEHAIIPMPLNSATSLKTSHQINNTHNIKSSSSNNHHHQQQQINNGRCKTRHKSNEVAAMTASPQVQGYSKLMSSTCHQKVNAAILNALNPSQALELKLTRKMNHEKELLSLSKSNELRLNLGDELKSKCKDENVLNSTYVEKIRITEKLSDKFNDLQSKKRDNIKRSNKYQTKVVNQSEVVQNSLKSNGFVVEYASIPITVDPTECENLLKATSDDDAATTPDDVANTLTADNLSASAVHRYVHEHIHHHYHHFEGANVD